ncbi:MAG: TetR/AcrR family transcriptional regulator [Anaerolineae bacterium]|nr:TetR/AcrR family transcriptional regulator [Anaerolineae bacterium]
MSASDTESERKGRAEVRDRLLRAARARFARQGFEATTMQQIVQDAGTSIGNCYFYFHDKEDLMVAVIRAVSEEIERAIDAQMARAPSGPGRMAAALYFGVEAALARADIVRQVLVGASYPALRHIIHEIYAGRVRRFFEANPALLGDHDLDLAVCLERRELQRP